MSAASGFWPSSLKCAQKRSRALPKCLHPCTHMGEPEDALDSCLRVDLALVVETIWDVIHQMEDPPSLCV